MKAVTINTFGNAEGMSFGEIAAPEPGLGQVLIATEAIGVGGVDAVIRRGTIGGLGLESGFVPGSEVAGTVIGVGSGVDRLWEGRRVWAFTGYGGGYAERAVAALDDITELPEGLSAIDAVALGSAGPVAHFGLAHARFAAGASVLVRGAAGSIGITAVQLAASGGARSIGVTTSSPERAERLRALGADHILDRNGHGDEELEYDIVFDIVGGGRTADFIDRLGDNGRMVSVGAVAGYPPADFGSALVRSFQRSRSYATFSLNTVPIPERNRVRAEQLASAARGDLLAVVHAVMPLELGAQAHQRMDDGEVFGRIVLTP